MFLYFHNITKRILRYILKHWFSGVFFSLPGVVHTTNIHDIGTWISSIRDYKLASFDLAQVTSLLEDYFMTCKKGDGKIVP